MGRKSLATQRRAQIIDAFYRCVTKNGLQNSSMREIAKEARMQPSMLHHYFKDRDEMIGELVKKIVDDLTARYSKETARYKNPQKRFDKAVEFLFGPEMISDEHAGFFYDSWTEARNNEAVRESYAKLYRRFRQAIIDLLVDTGKASGLSPSEQKELASLVIAIQDGASLQWDLDRDAVPLKRMSQLTKDVIEAYVANRGTS